MKIITVACDRYADAAPAWWHLFKKNWPGCEYDVVFVTNKRKLDVPAPVQHLRGKDIDFGSRLRQFLHDYYTEEHLLIHMIDYFIKDVDADLVAQAHELCALPDIRHVRLRPQPHPPRPYPAPGFGLIDKRARYSLSLQPGIWETQVLYDLCVDGENPWLTEMRGSGRVQKVPGTFLSVDRYVLPHLNYYRRHQPNGLDWVRDNVAEEAWPEAVREEYG
jgi:hypothetical protein